MTEWTLRNWIGAVMLAMPAIAVIAATVYLAGTPPLLVVVGIAFVFGLFGWISVAESLLSGKK